MHLPKLTRRRVAASAPAALVGATLAGRSAAFAQGATPPASGGLVDSATPSTVQQHVSDLSNTQAVTFPVAVATTFKVPPELGSIASFDETANKSCSNNELVVISGTRATGGSGTVTFSVKDYACLEDPFFLEGPAVVQATPQTATLALITATAEIDSANDDVVITVYSWDLTGQPLPNIWFYWTCITPGDFPQP